MEQREFVKWQTVIRKLAGPPGLGCRTGDERCEPSRPNTAGSGDPARANGLYSRHIENGS